MNTKRIKLSRELRECAAIYASSLDEIGGKNNPKLAELLLEDDEEPAARRVLKTLTGAKRDEVFWTLGWFRGVADHLGCEPEELLRASRTVKLEAA